MSFSLRWLSLCLACALVAGSAQTPATAPPAAPAPGLAPQSPRRVLIPDGERLTYSATWRLWKVGTASLTLDARPASNHIFFQADSLGVANVLYPVRDRIESSYDPLFFCATTVQKQTLEGHRKRLTLIHYEPHRRRLVLDEDNLNLAPPVSKHQVKPINGCVLDLFSALYYVRSLPLKVGEVYNFPVNEGGKTAEVQLTAEMKETVVTPAGTFQTIRTQPTVFNNAVFRRKGRMWVWFSDDDRHLPVMVKAKVSWGTIIAVLTGVSHVPPSQSDPVIPLPRNVHSLP